MHTITAILRRAGFMTVALCAVLALTTMSVAAQVNVGGIYPTGAATYQGGTTSVGVYTDANGNIVSPYQPTAADFAAVGCDAGNFSCFAANGGNYSGFNAAGCAAGNFSCLAANGVAYPGYPGYTGYPGYSGYPGYVVNPGVVPGVVYPNVGSQPAPGPSLTGYAANYNFSYRYFGIPDAYFTSNGCAVGDYTCLFGKMGNGATIPDSFFAAVGCPSGNFACATDQGVFTSKGCTIGDYNCVYTKTGKRP